MNKFLTTNKAHAENCRIAWLFYSYNLRGTPDGTPTLVSVVEREGGQYAVVRSCRSRVTGQWEDEDLELDLAAIPNVSHWLDNAVKADCKDKYSLPEVLRLMEDGNTFYPVFEKPEEKAA
tara:strand:+ start:299 stop:658 length:360 start_codon:yes stop_codon:yes gene_type:complete